MTAFLLRRLKHGARPYVAMSLVVSMVVAQFLVLPAQFLVLLPESQRPVYRVPDFLCRYCKLRVLSELIYRAGSKDKIMMPFYRFYVYLENAPRSPLLPEKMKIYGAYYVPAVDPVYLEK